MRNYRQLIKLTQINSKHREFPSIFSTQETLFSKLYRVLEVQREILITFLHIQTEHVLFYIDIKGNFHQLEHYNTISISTHGSCYVVGHVVTQGYSIRYIYDNLYNIHITKHHLQAYINIMQTISLHHYLGFFLATTERLMPPLTKEYITVFVL